MIKFYEISKSVVKATENGVEYVNDVVSCWCRSKEFIQACEQFERLRSAKENSLNEEDLKVGKEYNCITLAEVAYFDNEDYQNNNVNDAFVEKQFFYTK